MEKQNKYLAKSSIIEDAVYAIDDSSKDYRDQPIASNCRSGSSSCASQSKCGNSRASVFSTLEKVE